MSRAVSLTAPPAAHRRWILLSRDVLGAGAATRRPLWPEASSGRESAAPEAPGVCAQPTSAVPEDSPRIQARVAVANRSLRSERLRPRVAMRSFRAVV